MKCKVSLNGHELGHHEGMFSRFSFDLTPHLKPGGNELTVWVSMEKIPPTDAQLGEAVTVNLSAAKVISMSKGMFGPLTPNQDNRAYDLYGIWQPVKLVVRGAARIEDVWFQPSLTGARVTAELSAHGSHRVRFRTRLTDVKTGELLGEQREPTVHSFSKTATVTHGYHQLSPKLWTPAEPNLYRLDATLETEDGELLDHWVHRVGFRTFEVKGNQFYLNGNPYWLRGANQLPYGKNPWGRELPTKLVQSLHDANVNSTRTHATPWNEAWLDAADSIGLAVSVEGIRPWAFAGKQPDGQPQIMPPPAIFQHWLMENEDVVRRCRNHPSVFLFTVGNEMLLRDSKNLEKWKLLSEVTKQTRQLAPDRPIVVSSDYVRDPEFYESTLKPAGIDDGDVDDMHKYNGWYNDSAFVIDARFEKEAKSNGGKRPLMGQEFATGYPDLDTGLPVLRYTRDLLTPQAWVGVYAYPGHDPAIFLKHHAIVTKRWAELVRMQRNISHAVGFSLFSAECWFRHSYATDATPYPIVDAVRQAFAPLGVALETTQRRFFAGDRQQLAVVVTNDDERFRDLADLTVTVSIDGHPLGGPAKIASLPYYQSARATLDVTLPAADARKALQLVTRVTTPDGKEIAATTDEIELFPRPATTRPAPHSNVITLAAGQPLDGLKEGGPLRQQIEAGATAIVFSPGKPIAALFPDDLLDANADVAEFADWFPAAGTPLVENLQPMDLKWWARKNDARAFVATTTHRLQPGGRARELIRFIPAHSYIAKEKVPEQYRCVLSEIPLGKGRLWICDLDLAASQTIDPAARLFADNLFRAAADPDSTKNLKPMPTHEQLLNGKRN
jgi:hypothetical protein